MEIILSKQCESLTGSLGQGFGYHVQKRTDRDGKIRFWGVRKSKGDTPRDGHLKFILTCADLAQSKLHITDIRVPRRELVFALWRAGHETTGDYVFTEPDKFPKIFSAADINNFKYEYDL